MKKMKTIAAIQLGSIQIIGEIEDKYVKDYIALTFPMGFQAVIGDSIEDVINQIGINLRLQGNRDLACNDEANYKTCVAKVKNKLTIKKTIRIKGAKNV